MKISVLTSTYNRGNLLKKLYNSLIQNSNYNVDIQWLIIDDGSKDDTKNIVKDFKDENKIEIKYFYQENQGKMLAINKLVKEANGDLIIECDSDDYFTEDAFDIIKNEYQKCDKSDIYALCFLKYDQNGNNMGNLFKNEKTTMFDLYFKEGENGEKALVFFADVRKKYKHELEHNEKFVTEARMYHKMDVKYKMICINKPIMICEYQKDGYSKNIIEQFKNNPYGYYKYFQEILEKDMKGVKLSKRLYVIKHYILFGKLINAKKSLNKIMSTKNKILYCLLYVPGRIKTKMKF
ncbi:glycosyl transferase family 2 [Clostridium sp. CAG:440]|nr:glycosyl transferase family 2 [Clostridium sp. CAG:440]